MKPEKIHLGVYGVVKKNGKVLMIKKSRGPYNGLFDLPGGRIEPGESIDQALHREFAEEVGLEISQSTFLGVKEYQCEWESNGVKKLFHHIAIIFLVTVKNGLIKENPDGHDSNGACWVDESISKELISPIAQKCLA